MEIIYSLDKLDDTAKFFWNQYGRMRTFALKGGMGAGKTTFIHSLTHYLGVQDPVSSPTYSIINQYVTAEGTNFYHLDLYRLSDVQDAMDLGVEELLSSGALCFIEWPELISAFLPQDTVWMEIIPVNEYHRRLKVLVAG